MDEKCGSEAVDKTVQKSISLTEVNNGFIIRKGYRDEEVALNLEDVLQFIREYMEKSK